MESLIKFSHLCPTSPFSLQTEPYYEDYLVLNELPHIMITGKSSSYSS
jgi:DNA polymerase II small subunit/DNA polymerase delta subunit B